VIAKSSAANMNGNTNTRISFINLVLFNGRACS
jgi:hypothetical protein